MNFMDLNKNKVAWIFSVFIVISTLCILLKLPYDKPVNKINSVVCFGDSNTWGDDPHDYTRYPKHNRWTGILQDLLGNGYEVISEGMNGRTTKESVDEDYEDGLTILPAVLSTNKPVDILIFMIGTNDCKISQKESVADIAEGMEELIITARTVTNNLQGYIPKIIIVSPPAIQDAVKESWLNYAYDETSIQKSLLLAEYYQKIAETYDCYFVNGTDTLEVSDLDGIHMTENGHKQLAQMLAKIIKGME